MRLVCCAFFAFALAAPAAADEIELLNGETIVDCRVTDIGDAYKVSKGGVSRNIPKAEVKRVAYLDTSEDTYNKRAAALKDEDTAGHLELARWCHGHGLPTKAEDEFKKVLVADPDNEEARAALGFKKHEGRWMTEDEINRAKGLVKHKGRWMTPEEADLDAAIEESRELDRRIATAVRKAIDDLGSRDEAKRQEAADRLSRFENRHKIQPFLDALGARSAHARIFIARELGGMKDLGGSAWPATKALARRAIWDESEDVRSEALRSVREIAHSDAAIALAAYLEEDSATVRMRAEDAVGYFKDLRTVPPLIEIQSRTLEAQRFIERYERQFTRIAEGVLIMRDGRRVAIPVRLRIAEGSFSPEEKKRLQDEARAVLTALKSITGQDFGDDPAKWQDWIDTQKPKK